MSTAYRIADLQACEPSALDWTTSVRIEVEDDRDSMGFDRVNLTCSDPGALLRYVRNHWGFNDQEWWSQIVASMETVDEYVDPDDAPQGFRRVLFASAEDWPGQIHEGVVMVDAPSTSAGLYPFVMPGTARAIAYAWQSVFPNPRAAFMEGVDWFDVQPHWPGCPAEFVFYVVPSDPAAVDYDAFGFPEDPDSWGTGNLLDDPAYAARFPDNDEDGGRADNPWIDLGALGLTWLEVSAPS